MPHIYETYAQVLRAAEMGYALWNPEPATLIQYDGKREKREQEPSVTIGDVGYLEEGRWRHLFNIHLEPENQGNRSLPVGFKPISRKPVVPDVYDWNQLKPSSDVSVGGGIGFVLRSSKIYCAHKYVELMQSRTLP